MDQRAEEGPQAFQKTEYPLFAAREEIEEEALWVQQDVLDSAGLQPNPSRRVGRRRACLLWRRGRGRA